MKANEFVKKFGWDEAKSKVDDCLFLNAESFEWMGCDVVVDDLKRLVESHELVARYGTADEAKEYLPTLRMDSYDELKQAIADVESCQ